MSRRGTYRVLAPAAAVALLLVQSLSTRSASGETQTKPKTAQQEFAIGQLYFSTDDFPQAIEHFNRAIKQDPTNGELYYERGHAYYRLDQYIQAAPDYTRSLQLKFKPSLNYERRAYCYLNSKQYKKGIEDCTEAIKDDPRSRIAYFNRWKAYVIVGDHDKSEQDKAKLKELDKNPRAKDLCDKCQITHNKHERIELCTAALKLDPKYAPALLLLGSTEIDLGEYKKALECFNKLIAMDPNNLTAVADRGLCRMQSGSCAEGIKDLSQVLEQAPDCFQAYYWRGECYRALGQTKKALADYQKATELIKAAMGSAYARDVADFRNTLGRFMVSTYRGSAHAYEKEGNIPKALEDITIAINGSRMAPNDQAELYPERAQLYKKAGRDEEMHKDLLSAKAVLDKIEAIKRGPVIPPPPMHPPAAGGKKTNAPPTATTGSAPD